jgi:adenine-specific DNA-methyltransferase
MENRISLGKQLLEDKGVFICAIDENEQERLGQLLEYVFPFKEKTCISVVHNPRGIQGENFSYCHEYAYFIYPNKAGIIGKEKRKTGWRNLRDNGGESERRYAKNCFYPIFIEEGKIMGFGDVPPGDYHPQVKSINNKEIIEIWPIDSGCIERKWRYARNSVEKVKHLLRAIERRGTWEIQIKKEEYRYRTVWADSKYDSNEYGSKLLNNIMGGSTNFTFPKSLYNVLDCVNAGTQNYKHAIILDFFAGSGTTAHAVMKLNKEDGGKRKYMLIEMDEYFDTVVIPRIKKVCYSFNWKDGKPQDDDGTSQIIKYHYLEQYEDTLHNIEFLQEEKGQKILDFLPEEEKSEYLMKYMIKFETEGSPSLLNLKQFTNPFEYKLKTISGNNKEEIVNVDLVETFNYLIGLKINKYRYLIDNDGRKYVFVLGEKNYRKVAIVWRSIADIKLEKDKENIDKIINDFKPEEIYINGDSLVKNYKPIESEFKSRAGV